LSTIAFNSDTQVARAGGIEPVFTAIHTHPSHPNVQHFACRALMNIAKNLDNNKVAGGGIKAVRKNQIIPEGVQCPPVFK